jgi:predicted DsbA family dithiol-disulfide isomerase
MKVEIWSDIVCPFCYIGKRKFEAALAQFEKRDKVELEWKSFQLSPDLETDPPKTSNEYLAKHKGITLEHAQQLHDHVTRLAAEVGLVYDFNKAVVANSFNAHCFAHFAKKFGKQNEAEELLFRSYFTEGKNMDDHQTLLAMAKELGLNAAELDLALKDGSYAGAVKADIEEAYRLGVNGVPFFVFDRKYAVSGAQPVEVFLETLKKTFP